jgi:hypothetical protein
MLKMKKLAIVLTVFLFAFSLVQGQTKNNETKKEQKTERTPLKKLEGNKVSEMAKNSFQTDFKNVQNVQWKRNGTYDEAVFTRDGKEMTAFYDFGGILVGTTKQATWADLPAKGQQEIKNMYKDYTVGSVIFFDDNEVNTTDMIMYGKQFDDTDTYLVELAKGTKKIVVQVEKDGKVTFFKQL